MQALQTQPRPARKDRIDIDHDYAVCAWARHFNVSEKTVKEAVAAVGNEADRVREHLQVPHAGFRRQHSERPSGS
jgi:hypothetical protein